MNEEERFALLFGILLGDGCLCSYNVRDRKRKREVIVITGHGDDDKEFFESVLIPLLDTFTTNSIRIRERKIQRVRDLYLHDRDLFNKIHDFGFPIGKKGSNLFIPEIFYKKNLVKFIVQGFLATDGSLVITKNPNKFYPRVEGNGIASKLIRQIADYLNNLGMNGSFYEAKRRDGYKVWKTRQQQYRFQFNGVRNLLLFQKLVGFVNPKQFWSCKKFLRYSKIYDDKIRGVSSKFQKAIGEEVNQIFYGGMAQGRVELPPSCL